MRIHIPSKFPWNIFQIDHLTNKFQQINMQATVTDRNGIQLKPM